MINDLIKTFFNQMGDMPSSVSSMHMMALGLFVFALDTLPYQTLQHKRGWRYPSNSRIGLPPSHQFLGADTETITLSGVLLPELTGGEADLKKIHDMADAGKAWPLIEGTGAIYGFFVIEGLEVNRSEFFQDGAARRIEFTLNLKREDSTHSEKQGTPTKKMIDET